MKKLMLLVLSCFLVGALSFAVESFPRTAVLELKTSTNCGFCPDAYAGIEVVKEHYDFSQFLAIRYHGVFGSGDPYLTTETSAMAVYACGSGGFPSANIQGTHPLVGGGDEIASGGPYLDIIENILTTTSPINIVITGFSVDAKGNATVNYTVEEADDFDADAVNYGVTVVIKEHSLVHNGKVYTDVTRRVNRYVEFSGAGNYSEELEITAEDVNYDNLDAVVYVRNLSTKEIIQATTQKALTTELTSRFTVSPIDGNAEFEPLTISNVGGLTADFTVNLISDNLVDGWAAHYCDESGCFFGENTFTLAPGEIKELTMGINPYTSSGIGTASLTISSDLMKTSKQYDFTVMTDDIELLVIDGDGDKNYENYILPSIPENYTKAVYDYTENAFGETSFSGLQNILWFTGNSSISKEDAAALEVFLANGGHLLLTGQNIASGLSESTEGNNFLSNYLHCEYTGYSPVKTTQGVEDDIISHYFPSTVGLSFGTGANNQLTPDYVIPIDDSAITFMKYKMNLNSAAIRVEDGYRAILFGFGLEAVSTVEALDMVLKNSLEWMMTGTVAIDQPVKYNQYAVNYPNPFNPNTTIEYSLKNETPAKLTIFNLLGQKVFSADLSSNKGSFTWTGVDNNNISVNSGVYFYQISNDTEKVSSKMLLVK